jgi:hypothetical protein
VSIADIELRPYLQLSNIVYQHKHWDYCNIYIFHGITEKVMG